MMSSLIDDMEIEIGNGNNSYVIRQRQIPKECKSPVPRISISITARIKAFLMCKVVIKTCKAMKRSLSEAFAFCIGEEMGRIDDIIIPKQSATYTSVKVLPDHVKECKDRLVEINKERDATNVKTVEENASIREKNEEILAANTIAHQKNFLIEEENAHRMTEDIDQLPFEPLQKEIPEKPLLKPYFITGWTHSHVDFHAFSSGVDDKEHAFLHDQLIFTQLINTIPDDTTVPLPFYIVGITVNVIEQEYPVVYESLPCGYRIQYENKAVGVFQFGSQLTDDDIRDLSRKMYHEIQEKMIFDALPFRDESRSSILSRPRDGTLKVQSRASTINDFLKSVPSNPGEDKPNTIFNNIDGIVKNFASKETWNIVNDNKVLEKMLSEVQEMLSAPALKKRKNLDGVYDDMKEKIMEMLKQEQSVLGEALNDILSDSLSENDEDEDDDEVFCAVCNKPITDDNSDYDEDHEGNVVCTECNKKLCPECGILLNESNTSEQIDEDTGRYFCKTCAKRVSSEDE